MEEAPSRRVKVWCRRRVRVVEVLMLRRWESRRRGVDLRTRRGEVGIWTRRGGVGKVGLESRWWCWVGMDLDRVWEWKWMLMVGILMLLVERKKWKLLLKVLVEEEGKRREIDQTQARGSLPVPVLES